MTQATKISLRTLSHSVHRWVFAVIFVVLTSGIVGLNQTVNATTIDASADPFSIDLILGHNLTVRDNPDYDKLPKIAEFKALPIYSESDIRTYKLPALPPVKRPPADKKDNLTLEEQRFCLLVKSSYIEDATALLPACENLTKFELEEFSRQAPYGTIIRALNIARFNQNLDVPWDAYAAMNDVPSINKVYKSWVMETQNMISQVYAKNLQKKELNIEEGLFCIEQSFAHRNFVDLSAMGYSLKRANAVAEVFNGSCAGTKIPLHDVLKTARIAFDNDTFWNRLNPLFSISILNSVQNWKPNTFLPPNKGTPSQQKPEIQEAQRLLKQLGFYNGKETGKLDDATTDAIKQFEYNLGLNKTGRLTYTNLLRIRLYTVGFDAKRD